MPQMHEAAISRRAAQVFTDIRFSADVSQSLAPDPAFETAQRRNVWTTFIELGLLLFAAVRQLPSPARQLPSPARQLPSPARRRRALGLAVRGPAAALRQHFVSVWWNRPAMTDQPTAQL